MLRLLGAGHGCDLPRGHKGKCVCDCALDYDGDHGGLMSREEVYADAWVNVGGPPYYGPETRFYGEDVDSDRHTVSRSTIGQRP